VKVQAQYNVSHSIQRTIKSAQNSIRIYHIINTVRWLVETYASLLKYCHPHICCPGSVSDRVTTRTMNIESVYFKAVIGKFDRSFPNRRKQNAIGKISHWQNAGASPRGGLGSTPLLPEDVLLGFVVFFFSGGGSRRSVKGPWTLLGLRRQTYVQARPVGHPKFFLDLATPLAKWFYDWR